MAPNHINPKPIPTPLRWHRSLHQIFACTFSRIPAKLNITVTSHSSEFVMLFDSQAVQKSQFGKYLYLFFFGYRTLSQRGTYELCLASVTCWHWVCTNIFKRLTIAVVGMYLLWVFTLMHRWLLYNRISWIALRLLLSTLFPPFLWA